jgi:NAD(P)H-flavin reductase
MPNAGRSAVVKNPYESVPVTITEIVEETPNIRTFRLGPKKVLSFEAGQFVELTVPGKGEAPFTPSSSPFDAEKIEITIMKVGRVTSALFDLKVGDTLGIRGPYGKRYPLEKFKGRDILILGGGVGLAPLRSLFLALVHQRDRYGKLFLRYGARTPEEIVYKRLLPGWAKLPGVDVAQTVDVGDASWTGTVGVVTVLLQEMPCDVRTSVAVVCGPPLMMKFGTLRLLEGGFPDESIYLSMEKNMSCGLGQCGHCRLGVYFTCKDGPVLTWAQVKDCEEPFA